MLITPRNPHGKLRLVLKSQESEPLTRQIVFNCRVQTGPERTATGDLFSVDPTTGAVAPKLWSMNEGTFKACVLRVVFGQEIAKLWKIGGDGTLEQPAGGWGNEELARWPMEVISEIAIRIRDESELTGDEEGKSVPPSEPAITAQ